MERIKKKIQSQSGASVLCALRAFLVAAMVSVTIVAAAVTTVKRVNSDREAQQAQLTLISAAQLVRDEMEKTEYKKVTVTYSDSSGGSVTKSPKGTFGTEMQAAVEYVNGLSNLDEQYELEDAFQITATGSGFKMKPVNVSFVMKKVGEIYYSAFTLSIDETGETLFLKMSGKRVTNTYSEDIMDENQNPIGIKKTVTETYTWSQGIIDGIGDTNEAET